ncbi:MAG: RES family NAD+ phosphorylase [Acidobacteriia bacterium]|nr:RES family NAD+ phosphorylase [Terriglobia bacterium]
MPKRTKKQVKRKTARSARAKASVKALPPDEPEILSLCISCAKHPALKSFVKRCGEKGHECGICHRTDQLASPPSVHTALSSLVRALVRFYYDEWIYNGHWGGDEEPEALLCHENAIVEHAKTPGFTRTAQDSEVFLTTLFDPPYPDYDKGIAVYAGHHDGIGRLPPMSAISTSMSPVYRGIKDRLKHENYFEIQDEFEKRLATFDSELAAALPAGTVLFRARQGVARRYIRGFGWEAETIYQPYLGKEIGAPPPPRATAGRLNREGVSFLYLATDEKTAAAELRPHPGHYLSVAAFRSTKNLRVIDFGAIDIGSFSSSDVRLDMFYLGHTISREIGLPIIPEERHRYSITQLLADIVRRRGFDGIRFPSSLGTGSNYCIFKPALFKAQDRSAKVVYIKRLHYDIENAAHLIKPTEDDTELPGSGD